MVCIMDKVRIVTLNVFYSFVKNNGLINVVLRWRTTSFQDGDSESSLTGFGKDDAATVSLVERVSETTMFFDKTRSTK